MLSLFLRTLCDSLFAPRPPQMQRAFARYFTTVWNSGEVSRLANSLSEEE